MPAREEKATDAIILWNGVRVPVRLLKKVGGREIYEDQNGCTYEVGR